MSDDTSKQKPRRKSLLKKQSSGGWFYYCTAFLLLLAVAGHMYYRTYTCSQVVCPPGKSPVLVEAYFNDTCICADLQLEFGL